jgi:hypothetical protein
LLVHSISNSFSRSQLGAATVRQKTLSIARCENPRQFSRLKKQLQR